ncbi:MAG: cobalamin biosynthesis protein, partial [Thaumarchaeota archaeon]|nr:cobalamin biosynthesis protein [Nitrososphaerota archaeon]
HLNLGWFSAKLDTTANYLPARITGLFTVASAKMISLNWANCLKMLTRDHRRTESLNAGWSMSAMAGALGVMLEKPGFYTVGEPSRRLEPEDVRRALKIMKLNVLLFSLFVSLPLIFVSRTLIPIV